MTITRDQFRRLDDAAFRIRRMRYYPQTRACDLRQTDGEHVDILIGLITGQYAYDRDGVLYEDGARAFPYVGDGRGGYTPSADIHAIERAVAAHPALAEYRAAHGSASLYWLVAEAHGCGPAHNGSTADARQAAAARILQDVLPAYAPRPAATDGDRHATLLAAADARRNALLSGIG